jgi:hypothetical protein
MNHAFGVAASADMAVLSGRLGARTLPRTVQVRFGFKPLWYPVARRTVSLLQFIKHPGEMAAHCKMKTVPLKEIPQVTAGHTQDRSSSTFVKEGPRGCPTTTLRSKELTPIMMGINHSLPSPVADPELVVGAAGD